MFYLKVIFLVFVYIQTSTESFFKCKEETKCNWTLLDERMSRNYCYTCAKFKKSKPFQDFVRKS